MLARSSSVIFLKDGQGMGGRIGRPLPMCLPVRRASMKVCCDQLPSPVSESGVRLAVKLTPQGPLNEVKVMSMAPIQGGGTGAGPGIFIDAGCPESIFDISGSGPCSPIFHGVWQSPQ